MLKVEKQHRNDTVLLVAHRNCAMALECIVNRVPLSKLSTIAIMKNGEIKTFNYSSKSKLKI